MTGETVWCAQCQRHHEIVRCTDCGRELAPHFIIHLCSDCKAIRRGARNRLRGSGI